MAKPWCKSGFFHVSAFNFDPDLLKGFELSRNRQVFVIDSTLRKIQITPGTKPLSVKDKVEIVSKSDELGVSEIYAGNNVWMSNDAFDGCREIVRQRFKLKTNVQIRLEAELLGVADVNKAMVERWIDKSVETEADMIELESDVSDAFLQAEGVSRAKASKRLVQAMEYAKKIGANFAVGIVDPGRADWNYVIKTVNMSIEYGACRLVLYDSFGVISPDAWRHLVKKIRYAMTREVPLGLHTHDTFGTATASVISAVTAGAIYPDVALGTLATEAGVSLAPLEATVVALEILYGIKTGIRLNKISEYSKLIEEKTGIPVDPHRPIIGDQVWYYELESKVQWALTRQGLPPALAPETVGQRGRVVWGKNTLNGSALKAKLKKMGLNCSDKSVQKLASAIRKKLDQIPLYPVWLSESEVEDIARKLTKSPV